MAKPTVPSDHHHKILTIQVVHVFVGVHKNVPIKIENKTVSTLRVNTLNKGATSRPLKFKALSVLSHILNTHSKSNKTAEVLSQVFITFTRSKH